MVAKLSWSAIRTTFPIGTRSFSLYEWLLIASATRVVTGATRIVVNRPSVQRTPPMTKEQRWQSFLERCFMEGVGTPLHVLSVYWFQEPVSKILERLPWLRAPQIEQAALQGVSEAEKWHTSINKALQEAYRAPQCAYPKNIVVNQIYHRDVNLMKVAEAKRLAARHFDGRALEKLPEGVVKAMEGILMPYNRRLWVAAALTLGAGVLASAVLTGSVMQTLNDTWVSQKIIPRTLKALGIVPKPLSKPPDPMPDFPTSPVPPLDSAPRGVEDPYARYPWPGPMHAGPAANPFQLPGSAAVPTIASWPPWLASERQWGP